MPFEPRPLPCDPAAFAPQLSVEAVAQHRRHQQERLDAVNAMLDGGAGGSGSDAGDSARNGNGDSSGGDSADATGEGAAPGLADLARTARGALAAHAAQAWSDDFYWAGLRAPQPGGENEPRGALAEAIASAFGDTKRFRERFGEAALRLKGEGWVWLVQRRDGRLAILATPGAVTPLLGNDTPLLACCLWPHAFAQDYGDSRERYLAAFWQLVDWRAVAARIG